jgi:hypothetical protein
MSVDEWGNLVATLTGFAFTVAWIAMRMAGNHNASRVGITAYILLFPVKLWFWQFELTGPRSLPHWYFYSAALQILVGLGYLTWLCFSRFRPVMIGIVLVYVFSLILQLFSYMYWVYGTIRDFSVSLTHLDAFYLALGTFTTAGTGNIAPISETTRRLQTLQMGLDFILIGFVVVLVTTRYTNLLDRPKVAPAKDIPPITPPADWSDAT